jgi:hypothetical protein
MADEVRTHAIRIELTGAPPAEVAVGAEMVLTVEVSCAAGCDLDGTLIRVTPPDGAVVEHALARRDPATDATANVVLRAPRGVGQYAWSVAFPPQEIGGVDHGASTLPVCVTTKPHDTSLAVWAIPSSVVTGERFAIKVGAKSSAACELKGEGIEVCDANGAVVARGSLQATPWPGTSALYWTEVELVASASDGLSAWSVRFEPKTLEDAHDGTSSQFNVAVVRPPEHTITVKVVEKDTASPIDNAQVRLGAYRAVTDPSGLAELKISKGRYDISVWKVGYDAPVKTVDVDDDVVVEVEALVLPKEDPDAVWMM